MRRTLAIASALTIGLSVGMAMPALAAKKPMNKQCMATNTAGKKISFKCSAAEKCCWQPLTQKAACVPANAICL